jgi:uncharacterized RDD family membrane protein YckC
MSSPGIGLNRELITPEGVDLRLALGDAGERVAGFFIDLLIMLGILIALTLGVIALGFAAGFSYSMNAMGLIWILGFFLLRNFYFTLFELTPRAATPGKRAVGLRVASRDGAALTAGAIFARNAMRELEFFLPLTYLLSNARGIDAWISLTGLIWCAVFAFFPLFNRDRLRIGDLVAGTWVVKAPKRALDAELGRRGTLREQLAPDPVRAQFSDAALDAYGIKELNILEGVLRRKDYSTMGAVAQRIRAKIGFDTPMSDEDFLQAYYVALRGRLEARLLFGKRRKDKYEKI